MSVWYHILGVSDVFYGNNILWRSLFFGVSPSNFCSLNFGTNAGVLKVYDLRYPLALVCISFLYIVEV